MSECDNAQDQYCEAHQSLRDRPGADCHAAQLVAVAAERDALRATVQRVEALGRAIFLMPDGMDKASYNAGACEAWRFVSRALDGGDDA